MTYSKESFDRIFGLGIFLLFRRFARAPSNHHQGSAQFSGSYWINKTRAKFIYFACGAIFSLFVVTGFDGAKAQDSVLDPGDAVVTGFSGLTNVPKPNPLDGFFIDPQGPSLQVFPIGVTSEPNGQLLDNKAKFFVKAADVGQVFAITFERPADALPLTVPNIFVAASSTFGLQLVLPDTDGDGHPERTKTGHPDAQWMAGQFGDALGGTPGSIYRIAGVTGEVSLFANILGNSGAGLGDIVFDQRTRQFFVSDFDTGMIHRIGEDGGVIDQFDHGVTGRFATGLAEVADDGSELDIKSPAFNTENTATWGLTQIERRPWALGLNGGRLYYAIWDGPQIWSVGINEDGSFSDDPRKEFDVEDTSQSHPVSDMVFDGRGRLYLAQRGGLQSRYDYSAFSTSKESYTLRYSRLPDGTWAPLPEEYAVGFRPDYRNSSGGIDLGIRLSPRLRRLSGCDASIWSTGDALRDDETLSEPRFVHGLQGMETSLVRPANAPPNQSVFLDYDGKFDDPQAEGYVGDVEIWQPCEGRRDYGEYVPIIEPGDVPFDIPIDGGEPIGEPDFNLQLRKIADPQNCFAVWGGWQCWYTITVTNTGVTDYAGPITVRDWLPATPLGAIMDFHFQPFPWTCNPPTPAIGTEFECTHEPVLLAPGESVELFADAAVPNAYPHNANGCRLTNVASLVWPVGWGDLDPSDDIDWASADIPSDDCEEIVEQPTNLKIEKRSTTEECTIEIGAPPRDWCTVWDIVVTNLGPGTFDDVIKVRDLFPAGTTFTSRDPGWNCIDGECETLGPIVLLPNPPTADQMTLKVEVSGDAETARNLLCEITNGSRITSPLGGTLNFDAEDDEAGARTILPPHFCQVNQIEQPIIKSPLRCPPGYSLVDRACRRGQSGVRPEPQPQPLYCEDGWSNVPVNSVNSLRKKGWKLQSKSNGQTKIWCGVPPRQVPPPLCNEGWRNVPVKSVNSLRKKGWKLQSKSNGRTKIWCGVPPKPQPLYCGKGWQKVPVKSVNSLRKKGWKLQSKSNGKVKIWCGVPPKVTLPPSKSCPKGTVGKRPGCVKIKTLNPFVKPQVPF